MREEIAKRKKNTECIKNTKPSQAEQVNNENNWTEKRKNESQESEARAEKSWRTDDDDAEEEL